MTTDISQQQIAKLTLNSLSKSADTYDHSYSVTERGIEQRMLVGWWTKNAPLNSLKSFALEWGVLPAMVERWLADAEDSDGVGVTVNHSFSSLRLYTHHWNRTSPQEDIGSVVYRGYKSLQDGTVRVDDYCYLGDLRDDKNYEFAMASCNHPAWLEQVIKQAPSHLPLVFSKITNAGRSSWLATVRNANLDAGQVIDRAYRGKKLLHLAGGIDATKGVFDTFYLSATSKDLTNFIR